MTALQAIHQFIPSFVPRSAVGNHTVEVRRLLHEMGIASEIYVGEATREWERSATPFRDFRSGGDGTWLLYQASTGSPIADFLLERPEPKIVNYHNITPASIFAPWEPHVGAELTAGRRQLRDLAPATTLGIADSTYNRLELDDLGYPRTTVVPILLDTSVFERAADTATEERLRKATAGGTAWLFVGRVSPNKGHHDLLKAFSVYRRVYDPAARLRLVGGSSSHAYWTALERFAEALLVDDAVDLTGEVSDAVLSAHYRAADVFVIASDHEGFNVPLLEAMHHRLPIVAYSSTAVPETLGAGGLLLPTKSPEVLAAAVHRVVSDPQLRATLVAAGAARLDDFDLPVTRAAFRAAVESLR